MKIKKRARALESTAPRGWDEVETSIPDSRTDAEVINFPQLPDVIETIVAQQSDIDVEPDPIVEEVQLSPADIDDTIDGGAEHNAQVDVVLEMERQYLTTLISDEAQVAMAQTEVAMAQTQAAMAQTPLSDEAPVVVVQTQIAMAQTQVAMAQTEVAMAQTQAAMAQTPLSDEAPVVVVQAPVVSDPPATGGAIRPYLQHTIWRRRMDNPKQLNTIAHEHWSYYRDGQTVYSYLDDRRMDRRRARANVLHDWKHEFIELRAPMT
jgi:hypothetical protein